MLHNHLNRRNTKIDQLYIARKNVLSVVNQIRFTEELPERLKTMSARLNEDYTCLKVVYDEWIQYYSWTQKLKSQIDVISSPTTKVRLLPCFHSRNSPRGFTRSALKESLLLVSY